MKIGQDAKPRHAYIVIDLAMELRPLAQIPVENETMLAWLVKRISPSLFARPIAKSKDMPPFLILFALFCLASSVTCSYSKPVLVVHASSTPLI